MNTLIAHHIDRQSCIRTPRRLIWSLWLLSLTLLWLLPSVGHAAVPPRIIVKWKDTTRTRVQALVTTQRNFQQQTGMTLKTRRNLTDRLDVLQLDRVLTTDELQTALTQLRAQSDVEYAVVDERRHALTTLPDDPYRIASSGRSGQWYLGNSEVAAIDAIHAWDLSKGGESGTGVVVAVVDTGIRFDHPDLLKFEDGGKVLPGYDFVDCDQSNCSASGVTYLTANDGDGWDDDPSDPGDWVSSADMSNYPDIFSSDNCEVTDSSWHGTRVAGIIGAATNNSVGISGTGWNARILPVRALGKCGGYDSDIIAAMRWAAGLTVSGAPTNPYPAKVINLSLGGSGSCSTAYQSLINTLTSMGVTVVASAGNDSAIINTPANCSGVVSVVGVRNTGTKVGYSSLGTATIATPAGNCGSASGACLYSIDTTTNLGTTSPGTNDYTDQYNANLGTSFSAPIVSGTIALMLGADSTLTPSQIINTLQSTATAFPATTTATCQVPTSSTALTVNESECNCTTSTCGAGLLNAYQAVSAVSPTTSSSTSASSSSSSSHKKSGGGVFNIWILVALGLLGMSRRTVT